MIQMFVQNRDVNTNLPHNPFSTLFCTLENQLLGRFLLFLSA